MSLCKFHFKFIGLLIVAILSSFVFVSPIVAQKGSRIEALDILGNRRLSDEEILKHIKTRPGQMPDEEQLQRDLQSLLTLGLFNTTQTKVLMEEGVKGGVNVIFEVMELPQIVELNINGLRYVTKEEILTQLREQKSEVKVGMPYASEKLIKAKRVIEKYLGKRGFPNAKVEIRTADISATTLIVTLVINEQSGNDEIK